MSSTTAPAVQQGGTLRKKKSLKQLFIPNRSKSQVRSPPKQSRSSSQATVESPVLTAIPTNHALKKSSTEYQADPLSSSSSKAPSTTLSDDFLLRTESISGSSRQADKIVIPGSEQATRAPSVEQPVKQGRGRASTLTNFSKPYGLQREGTLVAPSPPQWRTTHQTTNITSGTRIHHLNTTSYDNLASPRPGRRAIQHRNFTDLIALSDISDDVTTQRSRISTTNDSIDSPDATQSAGLLSQRDTYSMQSLQSSGSSVEDSKHSSVFTKFGSSFDTATDTDNADEDHQKNELSVNDVIDLYADEEEEEEEEEEESVVLSGTLGTTSRDGNVGATGTSGYAEHAVETPLAPSDAALAAVRNIVFPPPKASKVIQWPITLHQPPSLQAPTDSHDQYGFRKVSRDVTKESYDKWYKDYSKFQARRLDKWQDLLSECGYPTVKPIFFPPASSKIQRYVRKGIPASWRGDAWFFYAGGFDLLTRSPGHYVKLVAKSQTDALNEKDKDAVERDLHRTFPDNLHFKSEAAAASTQIIETPIMSALRRVLCAFAVDHLRTGYCQSLNFIAGLLLLFLPEEKAYWMLHIVATRLLPGTHDKNLEGANIDVWVMMLAVKQANPGVWAKLGMNTDPDSVHLPEISLCTTAWFMSVYIGTLPIESVLRVWDVLFYEGSKTLFRVALGIFKEGESQIKLNKDPHEIFQIVQTLPRRMVDIDKLFDVTFSRGEVGHRWIEKKRKERKAFYAKERAHEKALKESREAAISPTTSTSASRTTGKD